jgi:hypothetical protein
VKEERIKDKFKFSNGGAFLVGETKVTYTFEDLRMELSWVCGVIKES